MITLPLKRSQWPKTSCAFQRLYPTAAGQGTRPTPSRPRPGRCPSSSIVRWSSLPNVIFLCFSESVWVGRAHIHWCNTVHMVGAACSAAKTLMASGNWLGLAGKNEGSFLPFGFSFMFDLFGPVFKSTGSRACHSAKRRATPRQIYSRLRSSGVQTRPQIKRYSSPFWKRASSGDARPYWDSKEWEMHSSALRQK